MQACTRRVERERSVRLDFGFEPASGGVVVDDEHVVRLRGSVASRRRVSEGMGEVGDEEAGDGETGDESGTKRERTNEEDRIKNISESNRILRETHTHKRRPPDKLQILGQRRPLVRPRHLQLSRIQLPELLLRGRVFLREVLDDLGAEVGGTVDGYVCACVDGRGWVVGSGNGHCWL